MTKLSIPLICECGFSTMDAKEAFDHAMTHHDSEMHIKNIKDYSYPNVERGRQPIVIKGEKDE
jgi:hypothetical protein